jgi:hypothetical protein
MHRRVADVVVESRRVPDDMGVGVRQADLGILEQRQNRLQVAGLPRVIGVELRYERGAREPERAVAGTVRTAVAGVTHDPQARVVDARERLGRGHRPVVVHHHQLEPRIRLAQDGLDRLHDGRLGSIRGHQDRRQRAPRVRHGL